MWRDTLKCFKIHISPTPHGLQVDKLQSLAPVTCHENLIFLALQLADQKVPVQIVIVYDQDPVKCFTHGKLLRPRRVSFERRRNLFTHLLEPWGA